MSAQGITNKYNHYEHLKRLYLFECIYAIVTTMVAGIVIYSTNADNTYLLLAFIFTFFSGI
jgi:hypothetical protein